jgi:hypothetical protein
MENEFKFVNLLNHFRSQLPLPGLPYLVYTTGIPVKVPLPTVIPVPIESL